MKYFYAARLSREKSDDKIIQAVPDGMFCYVIDQYSDHHRPALHRLLLEIKEGDELHVRSVADFTGFDPAIFDENARYLKAIGDIVLILEMAKQKGFTLYSQKEDFWNGERLEDALKVTYQFYGMFINADEALRREDAEIRLERQLRKRLAKVQDADE